LVYKFMFNFVYMMFKETYFSIHKLGQVRSCHCNINTFDL